MASPQTWHFAGSNTAARGSGGAGSCSQGTAELRAVPSPKSDTEAARANYSSRDGVSPFSYKFGKPRGNCSDAGRVVIFWKATGGDAKPAGTHWEQGLGRASFREGKGMSRGDAACFPAVTFWMGQVSTILLDNCHVHNGKRT